MDKLARFKNVIVSVVIIIIFTFVIKGILSHFSLQKREVKAEKSKLADKKEIMHRWEKVNQEYDELLRHFFKGDIVEMKRVIEDQAYNHNIEIISIQPSQKGGDLYEEAVVDFKAEASYTNFVNFIEAIESKEKAIGVREMVITSNESSKNMKNLDITVKGFIVK